MAIRVQAGRGTIRQEWSSDSFGDDEPVTVLAPAGADPDDPAAVRVSVTGFEGFEGGLDQASNSYTDGTGEHFEVDGQPAIYAPAGGGEPADLVVVAGDDLAVRVSAADAERDELVEVAEQVEPDADHLQAPAVPDPPGDLAVVGAADADVALTLLAAPFPASEALPAGERGHSAVWALGAPGTAWTDHDGTVAVSTLPGRALDLDAVAASLHGHGRDTGPVEVVDHEIDGRAGVVVEQRRPGAASGDAAVMHAVVTSTPGGDLLLVVAQGTRLAPVDDLVAVAASVAPATAAEWDELVVRAGGGPGLHPDDGAVELARGTAGGTDWLVQAREDDGTLGFVADGSGTDTAGQYVVDPCLKLDDGSRACPGAGSSTTSSGDRTVTSVPPTTLDGGGELPGYLIVMTPLAATTVRVQAADGPVEVPLVALPGGTLRGAAVVADTELALGATCGGVELLDATGRPLPCL